MQLTISKVMELIVEQRKFIAYKLMGLESERLLSVQDLLNGNMLPYTCNIRRTMIQIIRHKLRINELEDIL